jgi:hypothetical protein
MGIAALGTVWCSYAASRLFVRRSPLLEDYRGLIAYPCFLAYAAFSLLTLY